MFGAVGDNTGDQTQALKDLDSAADALGADIRFKQGATYSIWTDAVATDQDVLFRIDTDARVIDFNDARLHAKFTTAITTYAIIVENGARNVTILGLAGTQERAKENSTGVNWVQIQEGAQGVKILGCDINKGANGVGISRTAGDNTWPRVSDVEVTGKFIEVYKPMGIRNDGRNIRFNIETSGAGRSCILYGVQDVVGTIRSGNFEIEDVVIASFGHASDDLNTRNIRINYINRDATTIIGSSFFTLSHQQADATGDYASAMENITIEFDIKHTAENVNIVTHDSHIWLVAGVSQQNGQPAAGNRFSVNLRGRIDGNPGVGSFFMMLGSSTRGWPAGGTWNGQFTLGPIFADTVSRNFTIGQGLRLFGQHIYAPSLPLVWEGTPNEERARFVACTFSAATSHPNGSPTHVGAHSFTSRNGWPLTVFAPANFGWQLYNSADNAKIADLAFDGSNVYDRVRGSKDRVWGMGATGTDYVLQLSPTGSLTPYSTSVTGTLGTAALPWPAAYLTATTGAVYVGGTKVVGARDTGWTASTGTALKGAFATGTATLVQTAQRVKAIEDALRAHGLIN
jgi:hypothetical protein